MYSVKKKINKINIYFKNLGKLIFKMLQGVRYLKKNEGRYTRGSPSLLFLVPMPQSSCFIIQLPRRVLRVYWLGYLPGSVFRLQAPSCVPALK